MEVIARNKQVLIGTCPETSNYGKCSAFQFVSRRPFT